MVLENGLALFSFYTKLSSFFQYHLLRDYLFLVNKGSSSQSYGSF